MKNFVHLLAIGIMTAFASCVPSGEAQAQVTALTVSASEDTTTNTGTSYLKATVKGYWDRDWETKFFIVLMKF